MEFDTLYLELIDSTNMIMALLAGISEEDARLKPDAESWSVLETVCHLYDEEREDFREHLDLILNRPDQQWHRINPPAWVVERRYNTRDFRDMKEKFFGERSRSLDWLKGLAQANWDATYASPLGSMKAGEMFASWVAHDNLHLRQLVELRRARVERISQPYSVAYAGDW
jgi:hypothetical protein